MSSSTVHGARYALLAYSAWGLFPLYWKLLREVPALSVLLHRVFWSFIFYVVLTWWLNRRKEQKFLSSSQMLGTLLASLFIGTNWFLYIWAVNDGQIVETSLGYFINPLINVILGVIFFKERLLRSHKIAFGFAVIGVGVLTWEAGRIPWIALVLALTFGLYGLLRKKIQITSYEGGLWESLLMLLPVAGLVWWQELPVAPARSVDWVFLVGSGIVTGLPLIWFVEAAKRLPYYLMGFFQYLAPTLQFLTGVLIFHEPLSPGKLFGFIFIWVGIGWLLISTLRRSRLRKA